MALKVVAWNVRQGGGGRAPRLADAVRTLSPDVVMISEYRHISRHGLAERLAAAGLGHQVESPDPRDGYTGMLICSRHQIDTGDVAFDSVTDGHRFCHFVVKGWDLVSSYIPGMKAEANRKEKYWQFLVNEAGPALAERRCLIAGDLNTGLHYRDELGATLACSELMQELFDAGWRDAWVERNRIARPPGTWISTAGNPFRLDHALLSPKSPRARNVDYPVVIGGEGVLGPGGLSDHLPVVISLP